ncbi:MAG: beta-ketoacyl synthase chain length factor [Bacteroidota bacterium]
MYIKALSCISPQQTYDLALFENKFTVITGNKCLAMEPNYSELIPAGILRRMGKASRIGIGTGMPLLKKYPSVNGIILSTANGGLEDSMKFLNQIEVYQEGSLTPTNFVQSTPNAVAGLLSLMSNNTGYNTTHVHKGLAFECALMDAKLLFEENEADSLLVGNVEEISDWNFNIEFLEGQFKEEEITNLSLLNSNTRGTICGEGASMFIIESSPVNALCEIKDVDQVCFPDETDVIEKIRHLLERNNLKTSDVHALMLGLNGDNRTDSWYHKVQNILFGYQGVFTFKNLCGEYPTAMAFATWFSSHILQGIHVPAEAVYQATSSEIKNILIYNHYKGNQHGFILMSKSC